MTKTRTRAGKLVNCKCRDFEAHSQATDADDVEITTTGCTRQTNRQFAQGHDAKLVSHLVQWELAGLEIVHGRSTGVLVHSDAVGAALTVSQALAARTQKALNKAEEKAIARQARAETKAREKAAKVTKAKAPREVPVQVVPERAIPQAPADQDAWDEPTVGVDAHNDSADLAGEQEQDAVEPRLARIKVGRWYYDAIIDPSTQVASYKAKLGGSKTAQPGDYTIA